MQYFFTLDVQNKNLAHKSSFRSQLTEKKSSSLYVESEHRVIDGDGARINKDEDDQSPQTRPMSAGRIRTSVGNTPSKWLLISLYFPLPHTEVECSSFNSCLSQLPFPSELIFLFSGFF